VRRSAGGCKQHRTRQTNGDTNCPQARSAMKESRNVCSSRRHSCPKRPQLYLCTDRNMPTSRDKVVVARDLHPKRIERTARPSRWLCASNFTKGISHLWATRATGSSSSRGTDAFRIDRDEIREEARHDGKYVLRTNTDPGGAQHVCAANLLIEEPDASTGTRGEQRERPRRLL